MSSLSAAEAEALVQKLEQLSENPPSVIMDNEDLRRRFREATNAASLAVQWPSDIVHLIGHGPLFTSMVRVGVDSKIFEILAASSGPLSSEEVAEKTSVEPVLASKLNAVIFRCQDTIDLASRTVLAILRSLPLGQRYQWYSVRRQQCHKGIGPSFWNGN
jgi:peptide subunit release factor RF-3